MLFVGKLDARNAQDRVQGIKEVLAGSNITIIDVRTDDVDDVRAKANAADTLVRYPDVKALVGLWSYNGPAILNAVREAGKVGKVQIVTFDEADETLAGIKAGAIHATVVQQPYEFGYQAIKTDGAGRAWRSLVHPGDETDHRADARREPRQRGRVHAAHQHIAGAINGPRDFVESSSFSGQPGSDRRRACTSSWLEAIGYAQAARGPARALIQQPRLGADFDRRVLGAFLEHLGRAIYTGVYQPGSSLADAKGFRTDVVREVKEIGVPIVRYPGGNFVSGYNWLDGVGPKPQRPTVLERAWNSMETNQFGTNEFIDWCRMVGSEPLLGMNFGTGSAEMAVAYVEYCNYERGTKWSDLRRAHGYEKPTTCGTGASATRWTGRGRSGRCRRVSTGARRAMRHGRCASSTAICS
jgi:hypothetical protein